MKRISIEEFKERFEDIIDEVRITQEEVEVVKIMFVIKPVLDPEGWDNEPLTKPSEHRARTTRNFKRNRNKG